MKSYAITEQEKRQPASLQTGRECECGGRAFMIQSGGSDCCLWVKFICIDCDKVEDWDLSTGEC